MSGGTILLLGFIRGTPHLILSASSVLYVGEEVSLLCLLCEVLRKNSSLLSLTILKELLPRGSVLPELLRLSLMPSSIGPMVSPE